MQQEITNGFQLSPQQGRLWTLQQNRSADSPVYRSQCAVLLEGSFDRDRLEAALAQVVARHEIFRTTFRQMAGMQIPVQVVAEDDTEVQGGLGRYFSLSNGLLSTLHNNRSQNNQNQNNQSNNGSDHSHKPEDVAIAAFLSPDQLHPFQYENGPLLQASVHTVATERHLLLLSLPALCADSWSLNNLVQAISAAYASLPAAPGSDDEDDDPLQYVQFSEWQHDLLADEDAEEGRDFWQRQQLSEQPVVSLPFEVANGQNAAFVPASIDGQLDGQTISAINTAAAHSGVEVATVWLACWQTLLSRMTGQQSIMVGDVCAGREHEMLHDSIGLFAKWVPICGHIEPTMGFCDLLSQIETARDEAYEWQDYFDWESSGLPSRDNSVPHFSFGYEYDDRPTLFEADGTSFEIAKLQSISERFDVKLTCSPDGCFKLVYDANRFHADDIRRLANSFETLVRNASANPELPVLDLELLADADRHQLLVAYNNTGVDFAASTADSGCIHHRFEAQAQATPNNVALVFGETQLTFAELNSRANQLANYLHALSVGPEVAVGLCLERSVEMVVGLLGILKAGGAYVPLDPMYPEARLRYTLADVAKLTRSGSDAPTVLLTQERLAAHLTSDEIKIVRLDADWEAITQQPTTAPESQTSPANLAYIIYTSGSTGQPKGVMVQHGSVINLAAGLAQSVYSAVTGPLPNGALGDTLGGALGGTPRDAQLRVSLNAPLTFDSSVKQWVQLLNGHSLTIVPEEVRPDGHALLAFAAENGLDVLDCTPIQLRMMLEVASVEDRLPSSQPPKLVLVGGEAVDDTIWSALSAQQQSTFFNVYGPTECTVDATVCQIAEGSNEPSIGRPIANVQLYILDEQMHPVPHGAEGELYIGGAGLSRGYVNQPGTTAEKFVPHPFAQQQGSRLYRTGDRVRYLTNGMVKFVGRTDFQVKIRGYRIELGEIETLLYQHEDVHEAVAIAREDIPGDVRLVAYAVAKRGKIIETVELRTHLRSRLPEYMVPSVIVELDELPLNRNGKVNRNALPIPEKAQPRTAPYIAPQNNMEEAIATVWQEVLQVEQVGVNDNFFDLGGHSLLMVRVHNDLRKTFDKEISLIDMFTNPTVRMLAQHFSTATDQASSAEQATERAMSRADKRKQAQQRRRGARSKAKS